MADPSVKDFALALAKAEAIKFGSFRLTSGRLSPYYLDLRVLPSSPEAFHMCIEIYGELAGKVGLENFDLLVGVPTAGMVFASALAYRLRKPMAYVRKEAKGWGLKRDVEGKVKPGSRVVLVDDLITTGKSLLEAAEALQEAGGKVLGALVLIDREEGGLENLSRRGINLHPYTRVTEILEALKAENLLEEAKYREVLDYIKRQTSSPG
ncbi:MAG: orotate phosphoribosyltransferase [Candidatus Hecatellales archaeon B24]|nr:MAG: orotate phosphoribosyltransferase [Candidatus Hecatellales archaeon B24]